MAETEDQDSKTEQPTERKLEQAREKGQVAQSQEIKSLAVLLGLLAVVGLMGPSVLADFKTLLAGPLRHSGQIHGHDAVSLFVDALLDAAVLLAPPVGLVYVLLLAADITQVGLMFTSAKLTPKLSNISPIAGFKRIFSHKQIVELIKSILKLLLVGTVLWWLVIPQLPDPDVLLGLDFIATLSEIRWLLVLVLCGAILGFSGLAAADWAWRRHLHRQRLRMSRQELKDENKDIEGNPEIKAKIRQLRAQRARGRMMANVPDASVVITNPTHYAVALRYNLDVMSAPQLIAKGMNAVAARICALARDNDVPIVENPPLARALHASVELDEEVPPQYYKAVAEVIGYVMRLRKARAAVPPQPREGWKENDVQQPEGPPLRARRRRR